MPWFKWNALSGRAGRRRRWWRGRATGRRGPAAHRGAVGDAHRPGRGIDGDRPHVARIDDQSAVAQRQARHAVLTGAHRDRQVAIMGERTARAAASSFTHVRASS
ncbi:MAG: hypothetical protein ACJ736_13995 [Streptomyces sp.]